MSDSSRYPLHREQGLLTLRDGMLTIHSLRQLAQPGAAILDVVERRSPAYGGNGRTQP